MLFCADRAKAGGTRFQLRVFLCLTSVIIQIANIIQLLLVPPLDFPVVDVHQDV